MPVNAFETSSFSNDTNATGNATDPSSSALPPDMVFGEAQIISITVYSVLFVVSAVTNLKVLSNLLRAKRSVGLSRLNQLLLQLVVADLIVSCISYFLSTNMNE